MRMQPHVGMIFGALAALLLTVGCSSGETEAPDAEVPAAPTVADPSVVFPGSAPGEPAAGSEPEDVVTEPTPTEPTPTEPTPTEPGTDPSNHPPAPPSAVELTPDSPGVADILSCRSTAGDDPDGDAVGLETAWSVNGYDNPGLSSQDVAADDLESAAGVGAARGDTVRCHQRTTDGVDHSAYVDSAPVTLVNSAPTGGSALVGPLTVQEGGVVSCDAANAADADGDVVVWSYSWLVNGATVPGQVGPELTSAFFDKGDEVVCVATPGDGSASGVAVSSKTSAQVINTPPELDSATLTPAEILATGVFICTFAGWSDPDPSDPPAVTYAWERLTASGSLAIPGQSSAQLAAGTLQAGDVVRCVVTPHDEESTGPAVVSNPGTVLSGPPCADVASQLSLTVSHTPPSILLVVDRSGSMYERWGPTKAAVSAVLSDLGPDANTGLLMYPSGPSCSVDSAPQVALGADQAAAVVDAMEAAGVGGSTPMGKAMRHARQYLEAHGAENTTVILAADGKPSDTCLEDCTGCDCTDASVCLWCADLIECTYNEVRREVETLRGLGVRTFVIGYEGGFGATDFLESLAIAGGTDAVGASPFYDAGDGSALGSALSDIADSLQLCEAPVQVPNAYEGALVSVGGSPVALDPTHTNGWDLTQDGTLQLFGAACEAATAPGATVDVLFTCAEWSP